MHHGGARAGREAVIVVEEPGSGGDAAAVAADAGAGAGGHCLGWRCSHHRQWDRGSDDRGGGGALPGASKCRRECGATDFSLVFWHFVNLLSFRCSRLGSNIYAETILCAISIPCVASSGRRWPTCKDRRHGAHLYQILISAICRPTHAIMLLASILC